ncbi:MAG: methyltransferase domain-containing protein [Ignavibacteria bacterium]
MSTPRIYTAVIEAADPAFVPGAMHLDVGAGRGELIKEIRARHDVRCHACDFHAERFAADVPCAKVDFNAGPLPYQDGSFDVVTSSEVVEHLEDYRALLREIFRISKKGATVVVTTPNILNLSSRVRYLLTGFANLFGPLPVRNDKRYSTTGHITPIPYFYLAHALLDAGFDDVRLSIDKPQRTSIALAVLLWPLIALWRFRFLARERGKYRTLTPENEPLVATHFSWPLLVGRTIVVSARRLA